MPVKPPAKSAAKAKDTTKAIAKASAKGAVKDVVTESAEWVTFSAKTVEEAIAAAAEQLGLDSGALDVEVLTEPSAGLFGRTRGDAKIRARSAGKKAGKIVNRAAAAEPIPVTAPSRSNNDRAPRPRASKSAMAAVASAGTPAPQRAPRPPRVNDDPVDVDAVVSSATRFLSGLLTAADLDGTISHRVVDSQTVEIAVAGDGLGMLVGPKGQTLLAAQELLRTFVHHDTGGRSGRLMLDVASYREKRRIALVAFTKQVAQSVVETRERRVMEPMTAVDRKVVHDAIGDMAGVSSVSEGEDPNRYVVLLPA
jgi:spoIIIJ-associated protein